MRTNIVLDDELVNNCIKATGIKTKKSLIDYALKELKCLKLKLYISITLAYFKLPAGFNRRSQEEI